MILIKKQAPRYVPVFFKGVFHMQISEIILIYLVFINIVGFFLMGIDKYKAKKHLWRIPEKTLFLAAVLGGSVGTLAGMYTFHHKTRHWYFVVGMPSILLLQAALVIWFNLSR